MNILCSRCKKRVAVVYINKSENGVIKQEGLCMKCASEAGIMPMEQIAKTMGISPEELEAMDDNLTDLLANGAEGLEGIDSLEDLDNLNLGDFEMGGAQSLPFLQNIFGNLTGGLNASKSNDSLENVEDGEKEAPTKTKHKDKKDKEKEKKAKEYKFLTGYCENLTEKAKNNEIDRIVGRDREIYRVIQILNRRTKNNPCLIGEPGVGKTAIAEGIAIRIADGNVPAKLLDKEVYLLDLTSLVAGTQFRGQFESRMKGLIADVKKAGNVILFIDEVHNLVGAGDSSEGAMNAANILKPALSRGEIQVIGATTFNEYRKHIEKDAALERRFQPVKVEEPNVDETVDVIKGIKSYYESFHRVKVSDAIAREATILSERYITDRFLPDKAIDLIDEACSCAALSNTFLAEFDKLNGELKSLRDALAVAESDDKNLDFEKISELKSQIMQIEPKLKEIEPKALGSEVTYDDLAKVIELWTGIPASKIKESELKKVSNLEKILNEKVIGQEEATALVAAAVKRGRVQISPRKRPTSFIFVGPTGVGKTELAKVLSNELFSTTDPLIRLDMSEFMEKHTVARIIGAPPGYVGYDEAGQLTEKIRRRPYSVVLFDEIEKAHPDVMNILLQILDEGKITDAQGRNVSFENTIIIMTSNAGSSVQSGLVGFDKTADDISKEKALKALSEFLRPEFMGRVDEIVVFRNLNQDDFAKIAKLMIDEFKAPLLEKGIELSYTPAVTKRVAEIAYGNKSGARDIRKTIRKEVEDKICNALIDCDKAITKVNVSVKNQEIEVSTN